MALKNPETNEYLKVISMQFDFQFGNHHISYFIFANQEQRQRFDAGLSEYEIYKHSLYNGIGHIEAALAVLPANVETAKDAMFNACYNALKSDMFNGWEDC